MGTLKVNGNIEASTMLKLNGDQENDFGILLQEGGGTSYGAFIKYGLNDYLTIGTRNADSDVIAIKIYRGDNSITVNGSVTASSFIGNLSGNATSASSVPWNGITGKPSSFTPASHTHHTLTAGGEGGTASVRTADYTSTVLTGGWASSEVGYGWTYGTTLDISGFSTWYHRLAFRTDGNIEYWHGINTKTMTKVGNLCFTSHSHSYLPLSGGTMSGSPVIKFPGSAGAIATSDPMAITYGRISAYGTLCINANTDNSGTEYIILTAGKGLSSSTTDGLAIGTSTLTWQNNTIIHSGNYTSYCAPASHSHSYLPLSGGTMSGRIRFDNLGSNYIGNGSSDGGWTVGGTLGNLVLSSWFSISFTTECATAYQGVTSIGFDVRNSAMTARRIYATGWLESDNWGSGDPNTTSPPGTGTTGALYFRI